MDKLEQGSRKSILLPSNMLYFICLTFFICGLFIELVNLTYASSASNVTMVRVGLYYNTNVLDGINLENHIGDGFSFGYYTDDEQFVTIYTTKEESLSVVKTENVYYSNNHDGRFGYYDSLPSSTVVGAIHLQLPKTYYSYEEAYIDSKNIAAEDSFIAYVEGEYFLRIGNFADRELAEQAKNKLLAQDIHTEIVGTSKYGFSIVDTGTNNILFQYDDGGTGMGIVVWPVSETGLKCETWLMGYRWCGAFCLERIDGGDITVVNLVEIEDYVKGVLPYEMSPSWPEEALKAQAICARNYAMCSINRHKKYHFDVCNSSHCQQYLGRNRASETTDACVDATAGVLVYYNGDLAECYYHSSNGGATESSSVVWGSNQRKYPYLLGVSDPYEALVSDKISKQYKYSWIKKIAASDITAWLQDEGYFCSPIVSISISARTDTGNPMTVTFTDNNGFDYTLDTRDFVDAFDLRSFNYSLDTAQSAQVFINDSETACDISGLFVIDGDGNLTQLASSAYIITDTGLVQVGPITSIPSTDGVFTLYGRGWGHNVGLSQWGAYSMASLGFTYEEILKFYYLGTTLR